MIRSASAPSASVPLIPSRDNIAAGVEVTARRASGMLVSVHEIKLLTHSSRVVELHTHSQVVSGEDCISKATDGYKGEFVCNRRSTKRIQSTYLPANVSEPSNTSLDPFLTMLLISLPLTH